MSFRLFIYYCAACGGCAAYVGWGLGRLLRAGDPALQVAVQGLLLGMSVALALAAVDALWNGHFARPSRGVGRVAVAVVVGCVGGFAGAYFSQQLYARSPHVAFLLLGWALTGMLIGAAPGAYDYLRTLRTAEDRRRPSRKVQRGALGGALGGLLGGLLYLWLEAAWAAVLRGKEGTFWSPSATGFVALGVCIGLLIGLAQVILKEAWLRVEAGFRPGRELILSKGETTIGRAETCDLGLFGDPGIERLHARIVRKEGEWVLCDDGAPGGTYLNGQRLDGLAPLRSNDIIRVGRSVLRFGERRRTRA